MKVPHENGKKLSINGNRLKIHNVNREIYLFIYLKKINLDKIIFKSIQMVVECLTLNE